MHAKEILRCVALVLAGSFLLLTACGGGNGGGGDDGDGGPGSVDLLSLANQDGKLIFSITFGNIIDTAQAPVLGYNIFTELEMGFWTFDLSSIPAGATINSATLEVDQLNTVLNPQATIGLVALAHVPALAATPQVTEVLNALEDPIRDGAGLVTILSFTQVAGLRTMDVTNQVRRDLNEGRDRSRFRLTGTNPLLVVGPAGQYVFEETPLLRVTYQ